MPTPHQDAFSHYSLIQDRILLSHLNASDPPEPGDDNQDVDSTPETQSPSELRAILPAHCYWCWGAHSSQHCPQMLDILLSPLFCRSCGAPCPYLRCYGCFKRQLDHDNILVAVATKRITREQALDAYLQLRANAKHLLA